MTEYYINITKEEIEGYDAITVSITDEDDIIIVSSTEFQRLRDILNSMNDDIDNMILDNIQQVIDNLTTGEYVLNYSTNSTNLINDDETLTFEMVKDAVGLFEMLKEINKNFELISIGREARISLTATNPYLLSNGTTDVVMKLKDDLGEPLTNKKVAIEQSVFIDNGTTVSHNDDWVKFNPDNITITRGGEYTSVTGSNYRYGVPISNNCKIKVETRKAQSTGTLLSIWGYNSNPLTASQLLLFSVTELGMTQGTFANIEMTVTPTTVTVKNLDNGTTITKEYSTTYNLIMNFWGTTFDYKNFKIYETINGITNNQGIYTLSDVSVNDDTTFTATYGTVSDSCLVEDCVFVDYAIKGKHNHNYFNQAGTSKVTITEADEYKEFKTISTTAGNVYIGSPTNYTGFDVGDTWTIIWEKLYIEGYNVGFQCYNGNTTVGINSTTLLSHNNDFQELKFVCDGSSIKAYVDGVYKAQTSYTSTGHGYLRINLNNNNGESPVTFRAKNIRIKKD